MSGTSKAFWDAWHIREKELMNREPSCTCGKKHPDKTMHYASCLYLIFWDDEFEKFMKEHEKPRGLEQFMREKHE